jgi:hypothetical protein
MKGEGDGVALRLVATLQRKSTPPFLATIVSSRSLLSRLTVNACTATNRPISMSVATEQDSPGSRRHARF